MKKKYLQPLTVPSPFHTLMGVCSGTTVSVSNVPIENGETGDEPPGMPGRIPL